MNAHTSLTSTPNYVVTSPTFQSRVIAVASGKGGVGKTNVAVNLGLALARRGLRVALLDADLGTANVDVILGLQPRYHLQHMVTGQKSLSEIVIDGPFGLQVIPGASGLPDLANLPQARREALFQALLTLDGTIDLLVIDTGAGVGEAVVQFVLAAGELLIVTNPEPTALTDAYALMKVVAGYQLPVAFKLVINSVKRHGEGEATGRRLIEVASRFLGQHVELLGCIPFDPSVSEAVREQFPLLQSRPYSPAAKSINRLAEQLWTGSSPSPTTTGVRGFLSKILSLTHRAVS
ncbi:MAG TPA: MinD/ParA family protein [Anaerolineae bacterium]|nr:MinD/ParA family protein [Anaerolineae bacterium]